MGGVCKDVNVIHLRKVSYFTSDSSLRGLNSMSPSLYAYCNVEREQPIHWTRGLKLSPGNVIPGLYRR